MDNLVQLSSVTQAMRARDLLKSHGINSAVQRITALRGQGPCAYGLKIFNRFDEAILILREHNIHVIGRARGEIR